VVSHGLQRRVPEEVLATSTLGNVDVTDANGLERDYLAMLGNPDLRDQAGMSELEVQGPTAAAPGEVHRRPVAPPRARA
jgi:hypothetical protein